MKRIVYDPMLKQPGCILLQVAMGGTVSAEDIMLMDWLTFPTPTMAVFEVTPEQLERLKKISKPRRRLPRRT